MTVLSRGRAVVTARLSRSLLAVAALSQVLLFAPAVAAQQTQGLALDRFVPASAGDRMFGVPSPYAAGDLTPHVMVLADYAHNPLVLRAEPSDSSIGSVVQNQLYLNLEGGLALWKRLFVDVDVPIAVYQSGDSPSGAGSTFSSPTSAQFGDLRFGARVVLFGKYHDPFQVALGGYLWIPTAPAHSFVGTGSVRGLPELIFGGLVATRFVWSAAAGPEIQGNSTFGPSTSAAATGGVTQVEQGTMFHWGVGAGFLVLENRRLQLGAEASGDLLFKAIDNNTTNAELLFDARYRFLRDWQAGIGLGPGLAPGVGTPDFRGIVSVAYTPEQIQDRDHDGIPDSEDACPDVPGVRDPDPSKNGCPVAAPPPPPSDRDGDGIPDDVDACPDVKGVADPDPKKNGCPPPPPDRDGDGIPDAIDACPDVKGVANPDPQKNGCPPDRDNDGIPDAEDACPDEPGPRNPDPKKNGCPIVHVTATEVVILQQVQFDTGKATIKHESDGLLENVATVLQSHPELTKIEVQGHTDNVGGRAMNKALSQARADSVRKALIARGVDKSRLIAKGYGPDKPIADNATAEGRQENRRVQFTILQKKPKTP